MITIPRKIITRSPEQTKEVGRQLGQIIRKGDVICLWGSLGTGKTTMTQGICLGLEVAGDVVSPSFSLINVYQGRVRVYHMDLYRLINASGIEHMEVEECIYDQGVSLIEWPDRILSLLPEARLDIRMERIDELSRAIYMSTKASEWHDRISD